MECICCGGYVEDNAILCDKCIERGAYINESGDVEFEQEGA